MKSLLLDQFNSLKEKYPDAIILMRCGNFYETFNDDAKLVASILNIQLVEIKDRVPISFLAGFPFHSIDSFLPKLVKAGNRVAIVDNI